MYVISESKEYNIPVAVVNKGVIFSYKIYDVESEQLASFCVERFGEAPCRVSVAYPPKGDSYVTFFLVGNAVQRRWGCLSPLEKDLI